MSEEILNKLKNTLVLSDQNKSKYWVKHLKDINFKDINETGGWGNFTKKHYIKSHLHNLGQFYLFGKKVFKSKIYKMYKKEFDNCNRQIDFHVIKHILMLEKIKDYLIQAKKICAIGDGKLNFLLGAHLINPGAKIFNINLPEVLINDYMVMKEMNFLKDKDICVVDNLENIQEFEDKKLYLIPAANANFCKDKEIDFFFNSHSMQEMTHNEIKKYFDIIKNNKAYFYCNNREKKSGVDDDDDFYFEKMPWEKCNFLFKEICPITVKYYNFRPPNIRKFEKFIHCLAKFN